MVMFQQIISWLLCKSKINGNGQILKKKRDLTVMITPTKLYKTKDGGYFFVGFSDYAGIEGKGRNRK
jgi:hypothetical protein